jgi:predicted tellurium resistance membrane protein TerC
MPKFLPRTEKEYLNHFLTAHHRYALRVPYLEHKVICHCQVLLIDLVFSLDSVITAIGLANQIPIMIMAIIIALIIMLFSSTSISTYIERHPTLKMLALSFLLMVGLTLFIEGFGIHVPKGYIYTAMAFSLLVEVLNMRFRKNQNKPLHLR